MINLHCIRSPPNVNGTIWDMFCDPVTRVVEGIPPARGMLPLASSLREFESHLGLSVLESIRLAAPSRNTDSGWFRGVSVLKHRRVPLYCLLGPGFRVPSSSRAFSTRALLQSLTAFPFRSLSRGAGTFFVAIQNCRVARGIPVILATSSVV